MGQEDPLQFSNNQRLTHQRFEVVSTAAFQNRQLKEQALTLGDDLVLVDPLSKLALQERQGTLLPELATAVIVVVSLQV